MMVKVNPMVIFDTFYKVSIVENSLTVGGIFLFVFYMNFILYSRSSFTSNVSVIDKFSTT